MSWTCDNCKNVNPDRSERCLKCGADKGICWIEYRKDTTVSDGRSE